MSQDTRESGQPRKLYSHPITFPDELINMLGIAEGFSAFQHRLQFAEQMMSTIDYTLEGIRQKRHVNKLTKKETIELINGSGVDLKKFRFADEKYSNKIVLFPSRLLINKGVLEFLESAKILTKKYHKKISGKIN